jgi:hypothetical protein
MNKMRLIALSLAVILLLFLLISPVAHAALDSMGLNWWTADSGGQSNNGNTSLYGIAGQPDVGNLQGGDFSLAGGFLSGAIVPPANINYIYLTIVVKR